MPLNSARAGLSPQEGDVSRRKEVDQGRWSVSARRGREKVQEKKETKEGEKVAPDLVYEEAMCEGSSGNGLPYAARAVP